MSEISKLITEIKSEGILRAGNKLEQLYSMAAQMETDYAALQQKLDAMAGRIQAEMETSDIIMESLRQREVERDAMAAENAAIKSVIEAVRGVADNSKGIAGWHLNGEIAGWDEILPEIEDIETPATDTYLNSVRAEGVEILTARLQQLIDEGVFDAKEIGVAAGAVYEGAQIAANLRSGTHDTADKVG